MRWREQVLVDTGNSHDYELSEDEVTKAWNFWKQQLKEHELTSEQRRKFKEMSNGNVNKKIHSMFPAAIFKRTGNVHFARAILQVGFPGGAVAPAG